MHYFILNIHDFSIVYNFAQKISVNIANVFLASLLILLTSGRDLQREKNAGEAGCGPEWSYSKY
jgi:hypothetical protein